MENAGIEDLKHAFRSHHRASNRCGMDTCSGRLLLFYAVECGLKVLIMKEHGVHSIKHAQQHEKLTGIFQGSHGHNIRKLRSCLRETSLPHDIPHTLDSNKVHERWRYGMRNATDDKTLADLLQIYAARIEEDLNRRFRRR